MRGCSLGTRTPATAIPPSSQCGRDQGCAPSLPPPPFPAVRPLLSSQAAVPSPLDRPAATNLGLPGQRRTCCRSAGVSVGERPAGLPGSMLFLVSARGCSMLRLGRDAYRWLPCRLTAGAAARSMGLRLRSRGSFRQSPLAVLFLKKRNGRSDANTGHLNGGGWTGPTPGASHRSCNSSPCWGINVSSSSPGAQAQAKGLTVSGGHPPPRAHPGRCDSRAAGRKQPPRVCSRPRGAIQTRRHPCAGRALQSPSVIHSTCSEPGDAARGLRSLQCGGSRSKPWQHELSTASRQREGGATTASCPDDRTETQGGGVPLAGSRGRWPGPERAAAPSGARPPPQSTCGSPGLALRQPSLHVQHAAGAVWNMEGAVRTTPTCSLRTHSQHPPLHPLEMLQRG